MSSDQIIFLDGATVEKHLDQSKSELINVIETCLARCTDQETGGITQPVRTHISVPESNGVFLVKPAYSVHDQALSAKLITVYKDNATKNNLPSHQAVISLFDSCTGRLRAVMDGVVVTGIRTAAATAVSIRHLSRPSDDVLAIIGTGYQAEWHLRMLPEVRKFKEVRLYGRSQEKCKLLAERFECCRVCSSAEEAVCGASVVVTTTSSSTPVITGKWLLADALVNIVGAPFPDMREVTDDVILGSQLIVDTRAGAAAESGDIIQSGASIEAELGDVIRGNITVDFERRRVFKSQGLAVEDLAAAKLVVDVYTAQNS